MRYLFVIIMLVLTSPIYGQHIFPEKQYNCDCDGMRLENMKLLVNYQSKDSMYFDLIKNVKPKYMEKVSGEIMIQLVVDSNKKASCVSILNRTNVSSRKLKLVKNVNAMNGWRKPTTGNKKVCVIINLIYQPDKVTVKRLGIGGHRKFNELDVFEIKRKG